MSDFVSVPTYGSEYVVDIGIKIVDGLGIPVDDVVEAWRNLSKRNDGFIPIYSMDSKNLNNLDEPFDIKQPTPELNITFKYDKDFKEETFKSFYTFDKLPDFIRRTIRDILNERIKLIQLGRGLLTPVFDDVNFKEIALLEEEGKLYSRADCVDTNSNVDGIKKEH